MLIGTVVMAALATGCAGHGHITYPPSTRHGGSLALGGNCRSGACLWFSNNVNIPGEPTLPHAFRSFQLNITGGDADVFKKTPWRAPGTAPVYGSGCGAAGGGPTSYGNGGNPPRGIAQGTDGLTLPKKKPTLWARGSEVEVGWGITANHGGGYSYRLCRADGKVTEECFLSNTLRFAGNKSWIVYPDGKRMEFQTQKTTDGTYPPGSEWARDPVPGCYMCDAYSTCGALLPPVPGFGRSNKWLQQVGCYSKCDGLSRAFDACPIGTAHFPEPVPGISGFGVVRNWKWSIMDKVVVPTNLDVGDYLLSWRWDCEESTQIWQNCADIRITDGPVPGPTPPTPPTPPAPTPPAPTPSACPGGSLTACIGLCPVDAQYAACIQQCVDNCPTTKQTLDAIGGTAQLANFSLLI